MGPLPKIRMRQTKVNGNDAVFFARADSGMIVGSCVSGQTQFGEDPAKSEVRCFLDQDDGVEYIKGKCRQLLGRDDVDFIIEGAEKLVRPVRLVSN